MLEGTDARVHHIYYTAEMEEARNRGKLRTNSFVRLSKLFVDGQPVMEIDDFGDSEAILRNSSLLKQTAQTLIARGTIPEESGWGGWLGRYQAALRRMLWTRAVLKTSPPGVWSEIEHMGAECEVQAAKESTS
jgi:hypothetical protein